MSYINMKNNMKFNFLPISNIFIEKYISKAKPVFVCIYIFTLKKCIQGEIVTLKSIAEEFDILESDVLNSWKYWEKENVVKFSQENDDFSIEFLDIKSDVSDNKIVDTKSDVKNDVVIKNQMPEYTVEQLNEYGKNAEVKKLFRTAEKAFGSMLDFNKMKFVLNLYEWLGMSEELIEYLIKYCVSMGKGRNLRYIEAVAIDWSERGIDNVQKAKALTDKFNGDYREIMKTFGMSVEVIPDVYVKFMEKWLDKFSVDIVKEACKRTMLKTGKPALEYAETILKTWLKKGIKNISDIEKYDSEFSKNKAELKSKTEYKQDKNYTKKSNKFLDYEQRNFDFEKLNKLKSELLEKNIKD